MLLCVFEFVVLGDGDVTTTRLEITTTRLEVVCDWLAVSHVINRERVEVGKRRYIIVSATDSKSKSLPVMRASVLGEAGSLRWENM